MTRVLEIPALGEGGADGEGTIVAIPLTVGDQVHVGDTLLEIETDKVTLEIPAEYEGILQAVMLRVGDQVRPRLEFARLSVNEETGVEAIREVDADNDGLQSAVSEFEPVDHQGTPLSSASSRERTVSSIAEPPDSSAIKSEPAKTFIQANPSARRLAREIGVDISGVTGSGRFGRITKDDVKGYAKRLIQSPETAGGINHIVRRPLPDFREFGVVRRESLANIAVATSDNMTNAWSRIPHAWLQQAIDITSLEAWRQQQKHDVESQARKLTITVILAKAVAIALKSFPKINASYDEESREIVYKEYTDIGIAVNTKQGLVVPTLRQVDQKGMVEISKELKHLCERASARKLSPKDMQGAGITISNLGGIGLNAIFPIINWPQAAIIGVAASSIEPRFHEGEITPRRILTVTLGFDHRIINGADGAEFLVNLKNLLEDTDVGPSTWSCDGRSVA